MKILGEGISCIIFGVGVTSIYESTKLSKLLFCIFSTLSTCREHAILLVINPNVLSKFHKDKTLTKPYKKTKTYFEERPNAKSFLRKTHCHTKQRTKGKTPLVDPQHYFLYQYAQTISGKP